MSVDLSYRLLICLSLYPVVLQWARWDVVAKDRDTVSVIDYLI